MVSNLAVAHSNAYSIATNRMEGSQTARLERLKEVRKQSTAIAKERVKNYQVR